MLYTEKMLQKEIDRRLYEESERFHNARRFDNIEQELYKLQTAVDKAHARLDALTEKEKDENRYIADDGEEFDNREDCVRYEESRNLRDVKMLTEEKEKTDDPGIAWYVYLPNAQAYGAFRNWYEDEGIPAPERYELGCWLYSEDENGWVTFVDAEEKLSKRLIELDEIRTMLMGDAK